ncbi:MAG: flavodoxin domain-containing protein [Firmicutes bacterium]|nr:flavodoxin domain-containing protein [Bacillota bacterium]
MKIAVIFGTKHGKTKQYAEWIAQELGADLHNVKDIKPKDITPYDFVVYGGGLYAGGILGVKMVSKNMPKNLVVFTVGLADPSITDYSEILNKNFNKEQLGQIKFFHFRGGVDYKELSMLHKMMMSMVKKSAEKKPIEERTSDDIALLETYGQKVDFLDKEVISPLVKYVICIKYT